MEEHAQLRLDRLETQLAKALQEVQTANERASSAEMAKIQLSMQLAEMDDGRQAGETGPSEETEESFATSVTARRIATAEREVEELRQKLKEARDIISQLEFQVIILPIVICMSPSI